MPQLDSMVFCTMEVTYITILSIGMQSKMLKWPGWYFHHTESPSRATEKEWTHNLRTIVLQQIFLDTLDHTQYLQLCHISSYKAIYTKNIVIHTYNKRLVALWIWSLYVCDTDMSAMPAYIKQVLITDLNSYLSPIPATPCSTGH